MRAVGIIFSNIHDNNVPELASIRTMGSIPFGGRYRLIDFPLSNIVNSGIETVGIITKRNYQSLMDHVGSGKDWDLARKDGGLILLPPFGDTDNNSLYNSRLEALKGATNFLFRADEEYVVMTDCDNICRMDFSDIIDNHIKSHADITMVYTKSNSKDMYDAPSTQLELDGDRVTSIHFAKLEEGKEVNVFTNVYVMKKNLLCNIVMDSISRSKHHFTADVISPNLKTLKVVGYEHKGFFACISSLQAYYETSLKMLDPKVSHELFGDRSVFTKIRDSVPTKYGNASVVKNSMIADGCTIEGEVENSIIFRNVKIARGAVVKNSIVMQDTVIGEKASVNCIITDKNVVIRDKQVLSGTTNHPFYIGKGIMI